MSLLWGSHAGVQFPVSEPCLVVPVWCGCITVCGCITLLRTSFPLRRHLGSGEVMEPQYVLNGWEPSLTDSLGSTFGLQLVCYYTE